MSVTESQRQASLQEFELSPRTRAHLATQAVHTLGELLALPALSAPPHVLEEVHSLLDRLGVEFAGDLVVLAPPVEQRAEGSVAERVATVRAWLQERAPARLQDFRPAASSEAIAAAESELGVQLPAQYREFLLQHDGQEAGSPMVFGASLMPLEEVVRYRRGALGLFPDNREIPAGEVDVEVRAVEFSPAWIPIGLSPRGRDVLCLDLDPSERGQLGQVIHVVLDDDVRTLITSDFAGLLSRYFEEIQTGEIDLEADS